MEFICSQQRLLLPCFSRLGYTAFPGDLLFPKLLFASEFAMEESHFSVMPNIKHCRQNLAVWVFLLGSFTNYVFPLISAITATGLGNTMREKKEIHLNTRAYGQEGCP